MRHLRLATIAAGIVLLLAACGQTGPRAGDRNDPAVPRIEVAVVQGENTVRLDSVGTIGRFPVFEVGVSHRDGVARVEYRFHDTDWQRIGAGSFIRFSPSAGLAAGAASIDVRATSTTGQQAMVSVPFTVDAVAPTFTSFRVNGVESLDNPALQISVFGDPASESVLVQAAAVDPGNGARGVEISLHFDGQEVKTSSDSFITWQVASGDLDHGLHAVELFATDAVGNVSEVQSFLLDVLPPPPADDEDEDDPGNPGGGDGIVDVANAAVE